LQAAGWTQRVEDHDGNFAANPAGLALAYCDGSLRFWLTVPDDWHVQLQVELSEPTRVMHAPLAKASLAKTLSPPTTNIVMRRAANDSTPTACGEALVYELLKAGQLLSRQPVADVVFDDGAVGAAVELSFQPATQPVLSQRHLFRSDEGVVTHLCATATTIAELGVVEPLMLSFRP
jgi:hypothetical protein